MKLKSFILIICCIICARQSFAQKKENVYFFDKSGTQVNQLDSANYFRIVSEPDSGSTLYNVAEYYKDKTPKLLGKSSKVDPPVFEGQCVNYYPNGKKQEVATYRNGTKEGEYFKYYKNGKLYLHEIYEPTGKDKPELALIIMDCIDTTGKVIVKDGIGYYIGYEDDFKSVYEEGEIKAGLKNGKWKGGFDHKTEKLSFNEEYENGKLLAGSAVDQNNVTYKYSQREIQPQFEGGLAAFGNYLSGNIRYPFRARMQGIQGKVLIAFVVKADGSLTDYKVKRNPNNDLTEEALRVLKNSPKWVPGMQFGRKVRVSYTVPVNFQL